MPSSRLWRQLSPGLGVAQYSERPVRVSAQVTDQADLDGTDKAAAQAKVSKIEGPKAGSLSLLAWRAAQQQWISTVQRPHDESAGASHYSMIINSISGQPAHEADCAALY